MSTECLHYSFLTAWWDVPTEVSLYGTRANRVALSHPLFEQVRAATCGEVGCHGDDHENRSAERSADARRAGDKQRDDGGCDLTPSQGVSVTDRPGCLPSGVASTDFP
jgi:hypothetical protein